MAHRLNELARKHDSPDELRAIQRVQQIVNREIKELNERTLKRRKLR